MHLLQLLILSFSLILQSISRGAVGTEEGRCLQCWSGDISKGRTIHTTFVPGSLILVYVCVGCDVLSYNITQGFFGVRGARFVLNMGFNQNKVVLLSQDSNRQDSLQMFKARKEESAAPC